ncbi:MAG: RNA methyltransferase [Clostridiales bacterium]
MTKENRIFLGLVHYPIYNKNSEMVATSVTNLDIHDISRAAATYDLNKYFIIHPHPSQRQLVTELLAYWQEGYGAEYNPDRKEALARLALVDSLKAAVEEIKAQYGGPVYTIVTDARTFPRSISYRGLRQKLWENSDCNYLLLFGTGYGLAAEIMEEADYVLAPVLGRGPYNHLSVRSAAAIIIDRLLGPAWWNEEE